MRAVDYPGHKSGRFVDAPDANSLAGTAITADFLNAVSYELINVIKDADIDLDPTKENQLSAAIEKRFRSVLAEAESITTALGSTACLFPKVGSENIDDTRGKFKTESIQGSKLLSCTLSFEIDSPSPGDDDPFWCFLLPPEKCPAPLDDAALVSAPFLYNDNTSRQLEFMPFAVGTGFLWATPVVGGHLPVTTLFGRILTDEADPTFDGRQTYRPAVITIPQVRPGFSPNFLIFQWQYAKA